MYEMVEHNEFSQKLNEPAFVRAENYNYVFKRCENLEAENARLKAEVERLTKAGDAMAFIMAYQKDNEFDGFVEAWNAAKEGKQP